MKVPDSGGQQQEGAGLVHQGQGQGHHGEQRGDAKRHLHDNDHNHGPGRRFCCFRAALNGLAGLIDHCNHHQISQHAVLELNGEDVFEQISPGRRFTEKAFGMKSPSISGQVL